jgi:hypothetical protein
VLADCGGVLMEVAVFGSVDVRMVGVVVAVRLVVEGVLLVFV